MADESGKSRILQAGDSFTVCSGAIVGAFVSATGLVVSFWNALNQYEMDKPEDISPLAWTVVILCPAIGALISITIGFLIKRKDKTSESLVTQIGFHPCGCGLHSGAAAAQIEFSWLNRERPCP